jgi:MEDS: MEthanogen/methylotroph, DcmR Sensory domain
VTAEPFRHQALLYAGEEDFVARTSAFIRDGLAGLEPTMVVVAPRKIDLLREELGGDRDDVYFADMSTVGRNPARIIPAWQTFVERNAAPGVTVRGIGEPIVPERQPGELFECQRHESLLNVAFAETESFWLVCPYDVESLPAEVIEEARRSHPVVAHRDWYERSAGYDPAGPAAAPLPAPPAEARTLEFDASNAAAVPALVADYLTAAELSPSRRIDFVVAVGEIAGDSVAYGGGEGVVRLWSDTDGIVCEISDRRELTDPLADRQVRTGSQPQSRGLWVANQLCDLVQIRSHPPETVMRLHIATG